MLAAGLRHPVYHFPPPIGLDILFNICSASGKRKTLRNEASSVHSMPDGCAEVESAGEGMGRDPWEKETSNLVPGMRLLETSVFERKG